MERYGHQVVIGNDLNRRKIEVVFVTRPSPMSASSEATGVPQALSEAGFFEYWLRIDPSCGKEIEEDIIVELAKRHAMYLDAEALH